jgi:hypothetical protein
LRDFEGSRLWPYVAGRTHHRRLIRAAMGDWRAACCAVERRPRLGRCPRLFSTGRALLPGRIVLRRISKKSPEQLAEGQHGETNDKGDKLKDEQGPRDTSAGVNADGCDGERDRRAAPHACEDRPVLPSDEAQQQTGRVGSTVGGYDERRHRLPEAPSFGAENTLTGPGRALDDGGSAVKQREGARDSQPVDEVIGEVQCHLERRRLPDRRRDLHRR